MTPHTQPSFGISSSETFGHARGSMASKPNLETPYIYASQQHILPVPQIIDKDSKNFTTLGDLVILQRFLKESSKHYYFNRHRKAPGTDIVTDLVFAKPESLAILRVFPYVLIIDASSKENRYKIPFFEIVGITPKGKRFNVACAFIAAEREDNYLWVLNQISEMCWFVRETPKTIVTMTDLDKPLFRAVEQAFPHTKHLLGWPHICKNIEYRYVNEVCLSAFVSACKSLFESKTEDVYQKRLASMEYWFSKEALFWYLKQTWLTPYKEKIVSAWTKEALHFDIHTMDWEESTLKERLSNSACSFDSVWFGLVDELVSQTNAIKFPSDWSLSVDVPHKVKKKGIFKSLQWSCVSHEAYGIMVQEYERVKSGEAHPGSCVCQIRVTHGLPCAHEMAKYVADKELIPLEAIHKFWRPSPDLFFLPDDPSCRARAFVLDLFIRFGEMIPSEQIRCEYAVNKIMQSVEGPPPSMTMEDRSEEFVRKWFSFGWDSSSEGSSSHWSPGKSMSTSSGSSSGKSDSNKLNPSESLFKLPYIHETPFGSSKSLFKHPYIHGTPFGSYSNKFNPFESHFKPPFIHETQLNKPYLKPAVYVPEKPSNDPYVEDPYIREIPKFMVPYVTDFCEYIANGHCGFQAVSEGIEENGWRWVRGDMFKELVSNSYVYAPIFVSHTVETMLEALAVWTTPAYLPEQRLSIPDMGHIVAMGYQLIFVVLGQQQCITFLPLFAASDTDLSDMDELCLVSLQQGSKFIKVTMDDGIPLPPVHPLWARHHRRSVDGLDQRYGDRFRKYKWLQSFMGLPPPPLEKM